jgi:aspartate/methionine/tyrosine aminotransferase
MRTAFLASDAELIRALLLYRTYHGSAMGLPVQAASVAAWGDEAHVAENRRLMENTVCTVRSPSNAWTQRPAPRPVSTSCSGAIRRMR